MAKINDFIIPKNTGFATGKLTEMRISFVKIMITPTTSELAFNAFSVKKTILLINVKCLIHFYFHFKNIYDIKQVCILKMCITN